VTRNGKSVVLSASSTGKGFEEFARESFEIVWHTADRLNGTRALIGNSGEAFSISLDGDVLRIDK
jgi:hypothetical protein